MFLFFVELDWQKNDKATILVESIQLMKDLRAEVKRLKIQHEALLEESRDVREGVMSMSLMSPNAKNLFQDYRFTNFMNSRIAFNLSTL